MTRDKILSQIKSIRYKHLPMKLNYGSCGEVCELIKCILHKKYDVHLIFGKVKGEPHTWLSVNGIQIDPSMDCALISHNRKFVQFVNSKQYKIDRAGTGINCRAIKEYRYPLKMSLYKDKTISYVIKHTKRQCKLFRMYSYKKDYGPLIAEINLINNRQGNQK